MDKVVHIMTVGTSLLTNDGSLEDRALNDKNRQNINSLNEKCHSAMNSLNLNIELNQIKKEIIGLLKSIDLSHEISLRGKKQGSDRLPQELSYLWIRKNNLKNKPSQAEEIYLLPSNTPHAKFCAEVIKEYINNNNLNSYYIVKYICPLDGIDPYDGNKFNAEGIKNLFEVIHTLISLYPKNDRIYLNITGGYKGLVPYSTLQGMLYPSENVTICYLFEESPTIIEIPSYPIGVDFHLWHRNSTRLKMICEHKIEAFRENLDRKISTLLYGNQLNIFGEQLKERYENQLKEQPLEIYTKEIVEKLLPDSLNGDASKYRNILNNLIDRAGDNIWTGDKVPEMVEHAKRHHHNLLEFAEMFLTPILGVNSGFLNPEERFCLIAGILLHDCGHSLDYMETNNYGLVPLFPGEIREYHHLLSAMRLEDPELAKTLGWPKKNDLNKSLHDAVITVCRYHRRKMPFNDSDDEFTNPFTNEDFPVLSQYKNNFNGVDILKVVSLMRIIDGCDNQATRLGSKETVEITKELLKKDYESIKKRAKDAIEAYKHVCKILDSSNDELKNGSNDELKNGSNHIDCENMKLVDNYMEFRIKCLNTLKNDNSENNKTLARLWLTAAELVDRADMKHKQEVHYLKHQCVKKVLVIPSDNNGTDNNGSNNISFDVVLIKNDEIAQKYLYVEVKNNKTYKELIEEEVCSEYKGVEKYLADEHKMRLKYWWKEDYDKPGNNGIPFYKYDG